jgi:hypothetical protein
VVAHISRKTSEMPPNFLYAAPDRTAYAPFIKERRRKFREPTKVHRKSGDVGHPATVAGVERKRRASRCKKLLDSGKNLNIICFNHGQVKTSYQHRCWRPSDPRPGHV